MINLSNITLISITSVNIEEHIKALNYSSRELKFKEIILLTDKDIILNNIKVIKIPKINSLDEYSKFMVYELHKHINTDFCINIQDDGFIVNADKWDDEFLNYDYVGAAWGLPKDNFSYLDDKGNLVRVGNGGFSLRSKKILELPTKLNLEWKPFYGFYNEDGFFVCHHRSLFLSEGIKYAPLEVAVKFSHEVQIPETLGITPFGFHGKGSHYCNIVK